MLSPYRFVIGLIKLPPSDAKVKVTFPTIPSSLSKVTRYLLSHQGAADAVVVSSIVTANAVHNTFFFITFVLSDFILPFSNTNIPHKRVKVYEVILIQDKLKSIATGEHPALLYFLAL